MVQVGVGYPPTPENAATGLGKALLGYQMLWVRMGKTQDMGDVTLVRVILYVLESSYPRPT